MNAVKPHKKTRKTAPKGTRKKHGSSIEKVAINTNARWALTSDGAFVLLDTGTEIPQPAARALVDFVRRLDGGIA